MLISDKSLFATINQQKIYEVRLGQNECGGVSNVEFSKQHEC